jgi:hypothetical protein
VPRLRMAALHFVTTFNLVVRLVILSSALLFMDRLVSLALGAVCQ